MPTPSYTVPCLHHQQLAPDIYEFRLQKPEGLLFKAGQFVLFDVPLLDNPEDIQTRAFSIASAPHEEELLFVAKLIEGGRASTWIEQSLREGSEVRLQGPFGRFLLSESDRDRVFICTSSGNAPFRSMILDELHKESQQQLHLVFGTRHDEDLFWIEECETLAKEHENFHFHATLSQPSESWDGLKGRVQEVIPHCIENIASCDVYVCGNPAMTDSVKEVALGQWNVPKEQMHIEGYI